MTTATLNINKSLTVVTEFYAQTTNLSDLLIIAAKFDQVTLKGIVSTKKYNKYVNIMISNGYSVISENWVRHNEIADNATDFSITFSK